MTAPSDRIDAPLRVLVELRPALSGHAGIPQETRLLFRGLLGAEQLRVSGLLQSSNRVLAAALPADEHAVSRLNPAARVDRLSRSVVTLQEDSYPSIADRVLTSLRFALQPMLSTAWAAVGGRFPLYRFDPAQFRDFIWRALFAKTLPWEDFEQITTADYRLTRQPWAALHGAGVISGRLGHAIYPRFASEDFDILIGETPFPGRPASRTKLVIRYHDAIPLLMPHTISERRFHQACHFHALRRNVRDGAWFACVSDATRRDLISVFPEVEPRAVVIDNMVSHNYFLEESQPRRVPEILRTRRNTSPKLAGGGGGAAAATLRRIGQGDLDYLLMVSTIEPRKNHLTLLAAWEQLRVEHYPDLQLVLVGSLGWDHKGITAKLRPWLERGALHLLEDVPAGELRLLYRHALATVCPSFGEGFDYSGVEAMRCGGVVAASDIPVHREVFADAACYFTPYSSSEVARVVGELISPASTTQRGQLRDAAERVSARYLPCAVLPKWQAFLHHVGRQH